MRRVATPAADTDYSHFQRPAFHMTFSGPGSGKLQPVIVCIRQIETKTHGTLQTQGILANIAITYTFGQQPAHSKQRVENLSFHSGLLIMQLDYECFGLIRILCIGRRQPRKLWFPTLDTIPFILKIQDTAAIRLQYIYGRRAIIRTAIGWKFQLDLLQRKGLGLWKNTGRHGTWCKFKQIRKIFFIMNSLPEIKLTQLSIRKDHHDIAYLFIIQMKNVLFFMINDFRLRLHCTTSIIFNYSLLISVPPFHYISCLQYRLDTFVCKISQNVS